ncbi:hypothetical protein X975_23766, partial [Stegodyphus mimosarum]
MENRSLALRHVSEALQLDSNGFHQAAFAKYLQSLHILTTYLNDLFIALGFSKMLEKNREVNQVLCMIHECSDRVSVIINNRESSTIQTKVQPSFAGSSSLTETSMIENTTSGKFSVFEKLQDENMKLLKNYQRRLEITNDKCIKTNLKLEFERRLAENAILAKKKYDIVSFVILAEL